jgi:hypothetical protein
MEILFFLINIGLLLFLFYREKQHEKMAREILAAKLSRDVSEFKEIIEEPKKKKEVKQEPVEIPLEDVPAEEMIAAFKKK